MAIRITDQSGFRPPPHDAGDCDVVCLQCRASTAAWDPIAEQLQMRHALGRDHRENGYLDAAKVVEALLLWPLVERPVADLETEGALECGARAAIGDADGGVVDANLSRQGMPGAPGIGRLVFGELQQFERMPIGIAELVGAYAAR